MRSLRDCTGTLQNLDTAHPTDVRNVVRGGCRVGCWSYKYSVLHYRNFLTSLCCSARIPILGSEPKALLLGRKLQGPSSSLDEHRCNQIVLAQVCQSRCRIQQLRLTHFLDPTTTTSSRSGLSSALANSGRVLVEGSRFVESGCTCST